MTYRVPGRVGWVIPDRRDGAPLVVYLMPLPDGPPLVLRDSSGLIWAVAADGEVDVPAAVAELVGKSVDEVGPRTRDFITDLVRRGLLLGSPEEE